MKVLQYINLLIYIAFFFLGHLLYGQFPPTPKENNPISMSTLYNHNISEGTIETREQVNNEDFYSFLKYFSNYVDFYSIFNFDNSLNKTEMELKDLGYKSFDRFCSLKGIKSMSFYNYYRENEEVIKHTFYFNKENLLYKEIIDTRYDSKKQTTNTFYYEHKNLNGFYYIEKFVNKDNKLLLSKTFTFSKDKSKLLKITSHSMIGKINEIKFIYDKTNNIESIDTSGNHNYEYAERIIDLNVDENKKMYPWLTKDFWADETGREENIGIPNVGKNFFEFEDEKNLLVNGKSVVFTYSDCNTRGRSNTITSSSFLYRDYQIIKSRDYSLSKQSFFRVEDNRNLKFALLIEQLSELKPSYMTNYSTPNIMFFFIRDTYEKSLYQIKNLITYQSYIIDSYKIHKGIILNNIPVITNKNYTIKLKNKKELNEVFLIYNNKKYHLLTIK